jgi:hypothetical protein
LVLRQLLAQAQPQGAKEMTREELIRMAREAGIRDCTCNGEFGCLERFAALVAAAERNRTWTQEHWTEYERSIAAAEREACAKECEHTALRMGSEWMAHHCAAAIRARGQA